MREAHSCHSCAAGVWAEYVKHVWRVQSLFWSSLKSVPLILLGSTLIGTNAGLEQEASSATCTVSGNTVLVCYATARLGKTPIQHPERQ
jgi:hypothetical protein